MDGHRVERVGVLEGDGVKLRIDMYSQLIELSKSVDQAGGGNGCGLCLGSTCERTKG